MATVTKKFRNDFETWAAHRIASGQFSKYEIEALRDTLRKDLAPGADQLRAGVTVIVGGVEIPTAIDDHEERYRLWAEYFEAEAVEILAFDLDYFQTRPAEQEFSGTSHFGDACP